MNQLYIYIYPHISSLLHLPRTVPNPPLQVVTKHRADLPVLCSCFPLAIYFTFGNIYKSMPLSHFVSAYPSPFPCPQVHSLHLRLYSCPAPRFFITILNNFLKLNFIFLYSRFLLLINFIHISVYMSIPITQCITPPPHHPAAFPAWHPYVCSLHLCLYFCPENWFICTNFLGSIYKR